MAGTAGAARWTARLAVALVLVLGALVLWSAFETGHAWLYGMALVGLSGAALFAAGIERPERPTSHTVRLVGWLLMLGFSLVPTSFLFLPAIVVLCAAPSAFGSGAGPRTAPAPPVH